uniref:ATP-dependent (S)-NAD(P)H-hydrate dehydratase n=1 Tax=Xenopsylla cheopis TaxID=163159 RepID=A0A6M2DQC9_XENCH
MRLKSGNLIKNISQIKSALKMSSSPNLIEVVKQCIPELNNQRHKGQAGRIGVVGGSLEYTGAPYFAAISALKVGADLVHVFCPSDAAPVIKSYSPELIVHPLLNSPEAVSDITNWLTRLHVLIVGPGLGLNEKTFNVVTEIVKECRKLNLPLVIDADGLQWAKQNSNILYDYKNVIMTPNAAEFKRVFASDSVVFDTAKRLFGSEVVIMLKGFNDIVYDMRMGSKIVVGTGGSGRRCGGQGDLLSGAISTFFCWALQFIKENNSNEDANLPAKAACAAAATLIKSCNSEAFKEFGRSMTCSDMIKYIPKIFNRDFEKEST